MGSVFRNTDEAESIRVVHKAVENGINYIDTAPWYGHGKSETVLGKVKDILHITGHAVSTIKVDQYRSMPNQNSVIDPKCGSIMINADQ